MIILFAMDCSLARSATGRAGSQPPGAVGRSVGVGDRVRLEKGSRRGEGRGIRSARDENSAGPSRRLRAVMDLRSGHRHGQTKAYPALRPSSGAFGAPMSRNRPSRRQTSGKGLLGFRRAPSQMREPLAEVRPTKTANQAFATASSAQGPRAVVRQSRIRPRFLRAGGLADSVRIRNDS